MNKIEKKIKLLQAEGKDRSAMPFLMMNSEQQLMVERTKELTFTYSMIILKMLTFLIRLQSSQLTKFNQTQLQTK